MIIKKFEFDKSYKFENYSGITGVLCDSKTFLNKLALVLLILPTLLIIFCVIVIFIDILTYSGSNSYDSEEPFMEIFFGFIMLVIPTIILLLKVVNFKFYINDEIVIYRNWLRREKSYSTSDIERVYLTKGRNSRYINVEFNDAERVSISAGDRNFENLKIFFGL